MCNLTKDIFVPYASGISAPFKIDLMKSKPSLTRKDASTEGPERAAFLLQTTPSMTNPLLLISIEMMVSPIGPTYSATTTSSATVTAAAVVRLGTTVSSAKGPVAIFVGR